MLLLVIVVVVATRGSDGSSAATDTTAPTSTSSTEAASGAHHVDVHAVGRSRRASPTTLATGDEVGTTGATNTDGNSIMVPVKTLPLDVKIDEKSGLSDGDTVTVHVSAKSGSKIYGADARLCRADAVIDNSADYAPTQGGQCIAAPLSSGSDAFVEQAGADPFSSLDLPFRVGTGHQHLPDAGRHVGCRSRAGRATPAPSSSGCRSRMDSGSSRSISPSADPRRLR